MKAAAGAVALCAVAVGASGCGSAEQAQKAATAVGADASTTTVGETPTTAPAATTAEAEVTEIKAGSSVDLAGTQLSIPVPSAEAASIQFPVDFGQREPGVTVTGWSFDRPGAIKGTRIGGISVTYLSTDLIRKGDVAAIAHDANSSVDEFETTEVSGLTVISYPTDHQIVDPGGLPGAKARAVEKFIIVVPGGRIDLVFDDVDRSIADAYVDAVAKAVAK